MKPALTQYFFSAEKAHFFFNQNFIRFIGKNYNPLWLDECVTCVKTESYLIELVEFVDVVTLRVVGIGLIRGGKEITR